MISRRNIRVKVMQTLYTLALQDTSDRPVRASADRMLDDKLEQVLDLFTTTLLYMVRIAEYADTDARQRASKYLVTEEDRNVDRRIATNSFVKALTSNESFTAKVKNSKLERFIDEERVKKTFQLFARSAEYVSYVGEERHTREADRSIMQLVWERYMLGDEDVVSQFVDDLPGWEDDCDLIGMLMQNYFKGSMRTDFSRLLSGEKKEYAHDLLKAVLEKEEPCMELIKPKLNNWDKERVAMIDLLLLRMGVCEFLFFPTIPTKVTINEYIDIAKQYSTPQSGQFVNGVLDNILKDLVKEDRIVKTDRPGK